MMAFDPPAEGSASDHRFRVSPSDTIIASSSAAEALAIRARRETSREVRFGRWSPSWATEAWAIAIAAADASGDAQVFASYEAYRDGRGHGSADAAEFAGLSS